eukprot:959376-Prorocentrum_minimum.AAC.1
MQRALAQRSRLAAIAPPTGTTERVRKGALSTPPGAKCPASSRRHAMTNRRTQTVVAAYVKCDPPYFLVWFCTPSVG